MSRKEALTYEERISRLEMLLDQVLQKLNITYSIALTPSDNIGEFRDCDGALVLKDQSGDAVAVGNNEMFYFTGAAHHVFDETTGERLCSFGYSDTFGGFAVNVQNSAGETNVFVITPTQAQMPSVRETTLSSYDSVVVDSNGTIGIPVSERNRKRDIKPLKHGLEKVLSVQPIKFRWKDTGKPAIGFCADELKAELGLGIHEIISIVAYLWQAVRELAEEVK